VDLIVHEPANPEWNPLNHHGLVDFDGGDSSRYSEV
jgi:hypothetical protein